ncbi:MAG: VanZ family protein [Thermoplasmata archaeon]|nr:VanZ family protein [Thermoplasmata archaeon]
MGYTFRHAVIVGIWFAIIAYALLIFQLSSAPMNSQPQPIQTTYQTINETVSQTIVVPTGQPQRYTPDYLHLFLFVGFGFLLYTGFFVLGGRARHFAVNFAWLAGALYGIVDEYHQSFVPGRSMDWKDAVADASGVFLGILIAVPVVLAVIKLRFRFRSKWLDYV